MQHYTLTEIYIYPVKSFGGIRVRESVVLEKGLEWDRRWMVIDEHNRFLTQRTVPEMALFRLSFREDGFVISHGDDSVHLPLQPDSGELIRGVVWDDPVDTVEVKAALSAWVSEKLKRTCKLVAFPESNTRFIQSAYRRSNENVSLADAFPLLLIGQASLDFLNEKLDDPIPINRFRPNLVFSGGTPHEEDDWKEFRLGTVTMRVVKPCSRCATPTIDPETARKGKEPTRTLSTYRTRDSQIYFGMNVIPDSPGVIHEGDEIRI